MIGRGDVAFLHIAYKKSNKRIEKLTFNGRRFKSPFFVWLIQILEAVKMVVAAAITFLGSSLPLCNPAMAPGAVYKF
jgi:hypothetical protein